MSRCFFKSISKKEYIIFIFVLLITPVFVTRHIDAFSTLLHAHFITLVWNNLYIIFWYHAICRFNQLLSMLIPRILCDKFLNQTLKLSILFSFLYTVFVLSITLMLSDHLPKDYHQFFLQYCLLFILLNFVESAIILMQLNKNKNILYVAIPILLNLVSHYAIMPSIFSFIG